MTDRPQRAHSWGFCECDDPECGLHLGLFDEHERLYAEAVLADDQVRQFIEFAQRYLYDKATRHEA